MQDLAAHLVAASDSDVASSAFVTPDQPASKVHGVRSKKSCDFLSRLETTSEMCIAVLSSLPIERYAFWLFKRQSEQAWLSKDPSARPLVALTSREHSPVTHALSDFVVMTHAVPASSPMVSLLDGLDGSGWSSVAAVDGADCEAPSLYALLYSALQVATRLWRRQYVLYGMYPWTLVQQVDQRLSEDERHGLAASFMGARPCCLDEGCAARLRSQMRSPECLLPGGRLHEVCSALSLQKPYNAEIEDTFARHVCCAKTARRTWAARIMNYDSYDMI